MAGDSASGCFPITTKLFQGRLVMIRLRFHQATKRAGDWPLRFVRLAAEKAGNSRALLSQKSIAAAAADVHTYATRRRGGWRSRRQSELRAERRSLARVPITAGIARARRMFPFYSHSYFSRNRIFKLGLSRVRSRTPGAYQRAE